MIKNNSNLRLSALSIYVGILAFLLACTAVGIGSSAVQQGDLQLDDGIVEVQNQAGDWEPLAGASAFELVGALENTDPWTVVGRPLVTNESTRITDGLQVGSLVRVRGTVLENGDWLAYSIEPAEEQSNQAIIFIGRVTSLDPWVVNGITLNVTGDTVINGEIQPGMLVRVEILLLEDGTWEVISISPLGEIPAASGCATVVATVESVNGDQIKFLGWPTTVIVSTPTSYGNENDNGDVGVDIATLQPGQQVLVVVCVSEDNQLVITIITIIVIDEDDDDNQAEGGEKVLVCHKPGKKGGHTLSISSSAVPAHLGHGDKLGACP
jgi:hypothetical protein